MDVIVSEKAVSTLRKTLPFFVYPLTSLPDAANILSVCAPETFNLLRIYFVCARTYNKYNYPKNIDYILHRYIH